MALAAPPTARLCVSLRPRRCRTVNCTARSTGDASSGSSSSGASRRVVLGTSMASVAALVSVPLASQAKVKEQGRTGEVAHSEDEWRQLLGEDSYYVMRQAGTEPPFTSPLNSEKRQGTFVCAGCGAPLFKSEFKYNSGTGWPSFFDAIPGAIDETQDFGLFMARTECRCHKCKGHLGHVFEDGPRPTHLRYCMNGLALKFQQA